MKKWISVKERRPDRLNKGLRGFSGDVLVFGQGGMTLAYYNFELEKWMDEIDPKESPLTYMGEITHWIPLPEPPKTEE